MAALALSAMAAAGASAAFDSDAEVTNVNGSQTNFHEFTVEAGEVKCEIANFAGQTTGTPVGGGVFTSETITVDPTYEHCTNSLLGAVEVDFNSCDYLFTAGETLGGEGTKVAGTVHIECDEPNDKIEVYRLTGKTGTKVTTTPCTVTVPEQTLFGVTYHNTNNGTVDVNANVTGIHYIQHGVICPGNTFHSTKTFTNGTYEGVTTVAGRDNNTNQPVDISVT